MKRLFVGIMAAAFVAGLLGQGMVWAKKKRERADAETTSAGTAAAGTSAGTPVKKAGTVFNVYTDKMSRENHYIPSGYMGDYGDIKVNDNWSQQPRSGKTCIKIVYTAEMKQGAGWCGIFWQNPPNNWGTRKGGWNLTGAKRLTFWARGEKGGEFISEFKVGGITGEYPDSDSVSIMDVTLTKNWKKYEIDLGSADLSYISGGFCWAANKDNNPDGFTMYLDDIVYEFTDEKK